MIEGFGHGPEPTMTGLHVDALNEMFGAQAEAVAHHDNLQELFQTGGLEAVLGTIATRPAEAQVEHTPAFNELLNYRPEWVKDLDAGSGGGEHLGRAGASIFGGEVLDLLDVAEPQPSAPLPEAQAAATPDTIDVVPVLRNDGTVVHQMVHR